MVFSETIFTFKAAYFISSFITLLALINPIQKIFLINSLQSHLTDSELRYISIKSSITAFIILVFFLFLGNLIFTYVFRIELYSFRVTCGMVLVYSGWMALHQGVLIKLNLMSALVRIIGLIIATIGIQMIFDGGVEFLKMHGLIKMA